MWSSKDRMGRAPPDCPPFAIRGAPLRDAIARGTRHQAGTASRSAKPSAALSTGSRSRRPACLGTLISDKCPQTNGLVRSIFHSRAPGAGNMALTMALVASGRSPTFSTLPAVAPPRNGRRRNAPVPGRTPHPRAGAHRRQHRRHARSSAPPRRRAALRPPLHPVGRRHAQRVPFPRQLPLSASRPPPTSRSAAPGPGAGRSRMCYAPGRFSNTSGPAVPSSSSAAT